VPAGFTLPDPGDVPPSTEEAAASAAYHARKRRHAYMVRGGPAQAGPHAPRAQVVSSPGATAGPAAFPVSGVPAGEPGPRGPEGDEEEARSGGPAGSSAGPCGSAASTAAGRADWGRRPAAFDDGAGPAHDGRWANAWREDHPGVSGNEFGIGWLAEAGGDAAGARNDREGRR